MQLNNNFVVLVINFLNRNFFFFFYNLDFNYQDSRVNWDRFGMLFWILHVLLTERNNVIVKHLLQQEPRRIMRCLFWYKNRRILYFKIMCYIKWAYNKRHRKKTTFFSDIFLLKKPNFNAVFVITINCQENAELVS